MSNINFVPDDYIQKKDSRRAYWMYLMLCLLLIGAMAGSFTIIKIRENAVNKQASIVAAQLKKAQEEILQFEKLQVKRKEMMKTALTAVNLIEAVPRSFVLATLTNSLPTGTSLVRIKLSESDKIASNKAVAKTVTKPVAGTASAGKAVAAAAPVVKEKVVALEIEGIAPSDTEVADYIAFLNESLLFERVDLVYTQEYQKEKDSSPVYRKFKLNAGMNNTIHITKQDIEKVIFSGS